MPHSHNIRVLGSWLVFTLVSESQDHVIVIWDLLSQFLKKQSQWRKQGSLNDRMIPLTTVGKMSQNQARLMEHLVCLATEMLVLIVIVTWGLSQHQASRKCWGEKMKEKTTRLLFCKKLFVFCLGNSPCEVLFCKKSEFAAFLIISKFWNSGILMSFFLKYRHRQMSSWAPASHVQITGITRLMSGCLCSNRGLFKCWLVLWEGTHWRRGTGERQQTSLKSLS